jgi:hypothetical protein
MIGKGITGIFVCVFAVLFGGSVPALRRRFSDSDGSYTFQHKCGGKTGPWGYQLSKGLCSILVSDVHEHGMAWHRNGRLQEPDSMRSVTVDVDRFAEVLAGRLTAIVPPGFRVQAGDGMLWYSSAASAGRAGSHVRENFGVYGETDEDNAVGLAVQVLDELEDYVGEATGDPWPGTTRQPRPHGEIRGERLHLWYDDGGTIVRALEPIELADIADA